MIISRWSPARRSPEYIVRTLSTPPLPATRTVHRLLLAEQQVHYAEFWTCQTPRYHRYQGIQTRPTTSNNYRPSLRLHTILSAQYRQPPWSSVNIPTPSPCETTTGYASA